MKDFNLEDAKAGKPVCTRDGKKVKIIYFNRISEFYPIVALVKHEGGDEFVQTYTENGIYHVGDEGSAEDLRIVDE